MVLSSITPSDIEADEDCREKTSLVLVGRWPDLPEIASGYGGFDIHRCHSTETIAPVVHTTRADWMLAGTELDDGDIQGVIAGANGARDHIRLAILGDARDWRRCERWIRRGCRVYLKGSADLRRVIRSIRAAETLNINIIDHAFVQAMRERAGGPAPTLTRREREVLELLRRGFRNKDVAAALFVSENTVEYHVRHLLTKFAARNRVEVVERAQELGLV